MAFSFENEMSDTNKLMPYQFWQQIILKKRFYNLPPVNVSFNFGKNWIRFLKRSL